MDSLLGISIYILSTREYYGGKNEMPLCCGALPGELVIKAVGYAINKKGRKLKPFRFKRRNVGPNDVLVNVLYCGICHSDIHKVRNEWKNTIYPMVPGHEIVGRVISTGKAVRRLKVGDIVGIGCMVGSCGKCDMCMAGQEQFCEKGAVMTYNSKDPMGGGGHTYGGYSNNMIADERFVLKLSPMSDLAAVAPLMCAGITTYSPLKRWRAGPGKRVGIVGLGGLGHMAVKLAHSMGAHVTVFTTSKGKIKDAKRLGANDVVLSDNKKLMESRKGSIDLIIDTVSAMHDVDAFISLLAPNGTIVLLGLPENSYEHPYQIKPGSLIFGNRSVSGSNIGGIRETQEMLDYCAKHKIVPDIELIPIQKVNEAFDRAVRSDVKYRFVIDMSSLSA